MTLEMVNGIFLEALKITILISAPCLLFGLIAGVLVAIFQAATQINEMTLVFIPKMLAVGIALLIFSSWMSETLISFTEMILNNLPMYIK